MRRHQALRVHALRPGPGMGGHCLPVDPFYLTWRAREFHMSTEFIELAGKINQQMPYYCVERIERALNDIERAGARARGSGSSASATRAARATPARSPAPADHGAAGRTRGAILSYHDPFRAWALPELGLSELRRSTRWPTPTPSCWSPPTPRSTTAAIIEQSRGCSSTCAAPPVRLARPGRRPPVDGSVPRPSVLGESDESRWIGAGGRRVVVRGGQARASMSRQPRRSSAGSDGA